MVYRENRASQTAKLAAAVVGASAAAQVQRDGQAIASAVLDDQHVNAYEKDMEPGIHAGVGPISVVGANRRRLLIAELDDAVYLGGVRIDSMGDLEEVAALLLTIARRRAVS